MPGSLSNGFPADWVNPFAEQMKKDEAERRYRERGKNPIPWAALVFEKKSTLGGGERRKSKGPKPGFPICNGCGKRNVSAPKYPKNDVIDHFCNVCSQTAAEHAQCTRPMKYIGIEKNDPPEDLA